ncbi:MAG: ParB/Srx family N-terminal domain-containing protein [Verrucomicrobiia bacterium]|jgi:hypothetical protein
MAQSTTMATIEEITEYAHNGQLEDWIDVFLRADGNNVLLADGLKKRKRYWIGPVQFPLKRLMRCCGPEEEMEYRESLENWNTKVDALIQHIKSEGELAPVIAQYGNGTFSIRDGNHRFGAYEKLGLEKYWALIWCDSEEELEKLKHIVNYEL